MSPIACTFAVKRSPAKAQAKTNTERFYFASSAGSGRGCNPVYKLLGRMIRL
jgi:hypothetical protein